ncbi:MAG: hypothetical protein BWY11_01277 [Firmicutes bacterium ADurb.Bin182]|nr:MAG: hypothetical protein BWY11_01277 [Firmicutes bacterium ADurb.Bin182]
MKSLFESINSVFRFIILASGRFREFSTNICGFGICI